MKLSVGIRIVACFEAVKGLLVLCAGFGLLSLVNRDAQLIAVNLVSHFQIDTTRHYPKLFMALASNITNTQLWLAASFAFFYAAIRLAEGYGLWYQRRWAEWLAIASGGIYIPVEIYELIHHATWIKVFTLTINIAIVAYMCYVLKKQIRGNH